MTPRRSAEQRRLMDASEEALWDAASDAPNPERRIAHDLVTNERMLNVWRPRHLQMLDGVVSTRRAKDRQARLRRQATMIQHNRTLIDHVRVSRIKGQARERLFGQFFPNLDFQTAVLKEHRRYMLTVSSGISLRQLLQIHHDTNGIRLLSAYSAAYKVYFDLYCRWIGMPAGAYHEVIRLAMLEARQDAEALRHELLGIRRSRH